MRYAQTLTPRPGALGVSTHMDHLLYIGQSDFDDILISDSWTETRKFKITPRAFFAAAYEPLGEYSYKVQFKRIFKYTGSVQLKLRTSAHNFKN